MCSLPRSHCACGASFENYKELRVHIALETERWPLARCSRAHHDPVNDQDLAHLRWASITEAPNDQ